MLNFEKVFSQIKKSVENDFLEVPFIEKQLLEDCWNLKMVNKNSNPIPVVIRGLSTDTPSGLVGISGIFQNLEIIQNFWF